MRRQGAASVLPAAISSSWSSGVRVQERSHLLGVGLVGYLAAVAQ
jgi:hypothetical protein